MKKLLSCVLVTLYFYVTSSAQIKVVDKRHGGEGAATISASVAKKVLGFFANKNVMLTAPGSTDYLLSDREKQILRLMVGGHNYKAIADKSYISYETVRTHVKHIFRKLHVASRSEAVMKAIQQGLS